MKRTLYSSAQSATLLFLFCAPVLSAKAQINAPVNTVLVKRKPSDVEWKSYPVRSLASLPDFKGPPVARNRFGGRADRKEPTATGFFHVQKTGTRWWLVDPDGNLFLHVGVVSLTPGKTAGDQAAVQAKYGDSSHWASETTAYLRTLGVNGAGCWSDITALRTVPEPLVYTVIANAGAPGANYQGGYMYAFARSKGLATPGTGHANFIGDCIPVFHPDFEAFCETYAKPIAAFKNDRYLLGYFSDNELPVPQLKKYLVLPDDNPGVSSSKQAARDWWDARKGTKNAPVSAITDGDEEAWAEFVTDRYLSITTKAIRKNDPNHLCLGPRFHGAANRNAGMYRAAGRFLDVIGVNLYGVWEPKNDTVARWTRWSGKPVIITEFYAKGMDAGFPNTGGAGWVVPTQGDRGRFYQTFALGLLESGNCVGWHWFKYRDNDPADKTADPSNQDSNKGMVTLKFAPYIPLTDRMRELNTAVYRLADYFDKHLPTAAPQ